MAVKKDIFSYPDVFRVIQYTLDHKRLILQAIGLTASLLVLFGFWYLGYLTQGSLNFLPWFFKAAGIIFSYLTLMVFAGPVTYLILGEIQTGRRGTIRKAFKEGFRHWLGLALAPMGVLSFILASGILLVICNCLGMLPTVGPLIWSLLLIPQFVLALFLVVGAVTLLAETLLLPSIIVNEGIPAGRAFSALLRIMRKKFLTFWGYAFTALFLNLIYFGLATLIILAGVILMSSLSPILLDDMPGDVLLAIPAFFQKIPAALESVYPFPSGHVPDSWIYPVSGTIAGISLLIVYVAWLAYPLLYMFNSGVIIYLALREKPVKKSD